MPLTLAHPAAVLPLARLCPHWLSLPALVVGTLAPDFGYYVGATDFAVLAHSAAGLVLICLPAGLAIFLVLSYFRYPLVAPIPAPHRQMLMDAFDMPPTSMQRRVAVVCLSLILGAATHVVWDSFTHTNGVGVQTFPVLSTHLFFAEGREYRVCNVLQHASSLFGLTCVVVAYRRALARRDRKGAAIANEEDAKRRRVLTLTTATAVVAGCLIAASGQPTALAVLVVRSIICTISVLLALHVPVSLYWWHRHRSV